MIPLVVLHLLSVFERNHHAWWMYSECSSLAWVRRWVQKYTIGLALLVYAITVPNTPWKIHMEPKNGGSGLVQVILPFQFFKETIRMFTGIHHVPSKMVNRRFGAIFNYLTPGALEKHHESKYADDFQIIFNGGPPPWNIFPRISKGGPPWNLFICSSLGTSQVIV